MTPHMLGSLRCCFNVTVSIPSTSQAKWRSNAHCTSNYAAYKICPTTRRGLFPGTGKRFLSSTKSGSGTNLASYAMCIDNFPRPDRTANHSIQLRYCTCVELHLHSSHAFVARIATVANHFSIAVC